MKEIMVDIETLSTEANSIVVSIGAVLFDSNITDSYDTIEDDKDRCFYSVLDIKEQEKRGRHISVSTATWWIGQSRQAQTVFDAQQTDVVAMIMQFNAWVGDAEFIWGNGSSFDNVVLRNLWGHYGYEFPITYRGDMDMRTLVALNSGVKPKFPISVAHNALDDAKLQVLQVQAITKALGL